MNTKLNKYLLRSVSLGLTAAMLPGFCSCSKKKGNSSSEKPADYGSYGAEFARNFAGQFPFRTANSEQEKAAGQKIEEELKSFGYDVTVQPVGDKSANYFIKREGKGIYTENDDGSFELSKRTIVVGAHYDSFMKKKDVPEDHSYDGIDDNASGVAAAMTVAKELADYDDNPCDVYVVFFGASGKDFAGAKTFADSLPAESKNSLEAMYCIDSIYAGDKMYASSGFSSLNSSKKYELRRKIYQAYDVAYENTLNSLYGYNLLYNESGISYDANGDGTEDNFREIPLNISDYKVFDDMGIPVVYLESFEYNADSTEEMIDTKNLNLQEFQGKIRKTALDSQILLDPLINAEKISSKKMKKVTETTAVSDSESSTETTEEEKPKDVLEIRVNCTAFVILESMMLGSDAGMTEAQYKEYLANQLVAETSESSN